MFQRDQKNALTEWWWTVDRALFGALVLLLACGVVLSFAASPAVAERLGYPPYYFIVRHALFTIPTLGVLVGSSMLGARSARRISLAVLLVSIVLLWATLKFGPRLRGLAVGSTLLDNRSNPPSS